jgi:hypothetical protein
VGNFGKQRQLLRGQMDSHQLFPASRAFAVAIAHGAGLTLVPIYLGLCRASDLDRGHEVAGALINANLGMAILVSVVHSAAMIAAGGSSAWLVYRLPGSQVRVAKLVQSGCDVGDQRLMLGAISLAAIGSLDNPNNKKSNQSHYQRARDH